MIKFELTFDTEPVVTRAFQSKQQFDAFIAYEKKCTSKHFKAYCGAYDAKERKQTGIILAKARFRAHKRWLKLNTVDEPILA